MAIKILIDTETNKVVKLEHIKYREVFSEKLLMSDMVVVCEDTWEVCRFQESAQWVKRREELRSIKKPSLEEMDELNFLESL